MFQAVYYEGWCDVLVYALGITKNFSLVKFT